MEYITYFSELIREKNFHTSIVINFIIQFELSAQSRESIQFRDSKSYV